ncbi:MAG: hypothetical protein A2284_18600 [Deltaproteobacteria bacterium RIFOXYA12_FULL_61_11]|nr:MAG: hypothetical protein A2284_18600 [Deltaproteobacteria bacterium RIFOXYA12_FULL_61_11]
MNRLSQYHPASLALYGYASYVVLGWILLLSPWALDKAVGALDTLFIAMSAVSTTGLCPLSVADTYSFFGELVVLALIQVGGIGYMTFGSFVILARSRSLSPIRTEIGKTVFSLPASLDITVFLRRVIQFTLVFETLGTLALYPIFLRAGDPEALWSAVFHSVSAFCTAGFSLYNLSFEGFTDDFWLHLVIGTLSYLGAVGFIVCADLWRTFTGETERITLTSRIILLATLWMAVFGTVVLFLIEPSFQTMAPHRRVLAAFFQAMTAMTTVGFNTVPIGALSKASLFLLLAFMIIGASPSGTGGGLKTTTFTAIWGVMRSAMHGRLEVRFWDQPIPSERVLNAVAGAGMYLGALFVGTFLLQLTEASGFLDNLFEAASALGTVGLSMGITSALTPLGKVILIAMMFLGRLGPLTLGMAFFCERPRATYPDNDLAV